MANEENLKPVRSKSEARKRGANGGRASGRSRRERKTAKEILTYLLNLPIDKGKPKDKFKSLKDIKGKNLTALTSGLAILTKDVANGDKKAIDLALRITGEMIEQVQVNTTDETIEELKSILEEPPEGG